MNERIWDKFLTERDKAVFAAGGFGARAGFGKRPALLVVDVNWAFCGERPEPILESIKRWRTSCGEEAWVALEYIKSLIEAAQTKGLPVIYTTGERRPDNGMPAAGVGRVRAATRRAVPCAMTSTATKSSR
jgi:maleamate amidohydrolase